jgi:hypothetical protein
MSSFELKKILMDLNITSYEHSEDNSLLKMKNISNKQILDYVNIVKSLKQNNIKYTTSEDYSIKLY